MAARKKGNTVMLDLVQNYIGKECIVYTMNFQLTGTIKEATGDWISVDNGKDIEIVNIGFIMRIREFPRGKNGKKRVFIPD